jgi:cytochrome P450
MILSDRDPLPASPDLQKRLPPNPRSSMRELVRDPLAYFLSITRQYGDIVCYRAAPEMAFLVNHPDYIHHILVENGRNYNKDTFTNSAFKKIIGSSLINLEGDAWLQRRRQMQPAFHHSRLETLDAMITRTTNDMLDRWQQHYEQGRPVDAAREMAALTMTITSRALFGVDLEDEAKAIGEIIDGVADLIEKPHHPRLQQAAAEFGALVDRIIQERRKDFRDRGDLLSSLMLTRSEEGGAMLDDAQLRNEVMGLLLAGNDTTANGLTWTLYLLAQKSTAIRL